MDPFSITAGAITIVGTVRLAGKCIKSLRIARQAPAELKALLEEALEIHGLLEQLEGDQRAENGGLSSGNHTREGRAAPSGGLARLLERTASKLTELDLLIEHHSNQTSRRPIDHGNLGWARGQRKAGKLCDELKGLRLEIVASLGASTSSTVARVEVAVNKVQVQQEEARLQQVETARLLSTLVTGLALALPATKPPSFEYAVGDGSLNCNFHSPHPPRYTSRSSNPLRSRQKTNNMTRRTTQLVKASEPEAEPMQVYGKKSEIKCKDWCSCACHQKKVLRIQQPFSQVLGSISLAASGLPWITPTCDQKSCRSRSIPGVVITVNFPAWFWKRYLTSSFTYTPIRGPNMSFALPRTVGWGSKLWRFGLDGNLGGIRDLFITGAASPWDVSPLGGTILHYAAGHKHFKLCKYLVNEGAQIDIGDHTSGSPASLAWDYVLSDSLNEEDSHLVKSVFTDTEFLQTRQFTILHKITLGLISRTLHSELEHSTKDLDTRDSQGRTCVSWAAARGDHASLQTLLEFGADPNTPDIEGRTPLHYTRHVACGELLLSHGADLHARGCANRTVLHELCRDTGGDQFIEMIDLVAQKGIDIDAGDDAGETALMNAAFQRYPGCVRYLLDEAGADPARRDIGGQTALLLAVICDAHQPMRDLLRKGADPTGMNKGGETVLHLAAGCLDVETVKILREHGVQGVDIHSRNRDGKTAWEVLAEREDDDEAQEFNSQMRNLLKSCADPPVGEMEAVSTKADDFVFIDKMAALDIRKTTTTVTCVTPLSSDDEGLDLDDLADGENDLASSIVFYDAVEEMRDTPPMIAV